MELLYILFVFIFWYFAFVGFRVKVLGKCYCKHCHHNNPFMDPSTVTIDGGRIYSHDRRDH